MTDDPSTSLDDTELRFKLVAEEIYGPSPVEQLGTAIPKVVMPEKQKLTSSQVSSDEMISKDSVSRFIGNRFGPDFGDVSCLTISIDCNRALTQMVTVGKYDDGAENFLRMRSERSFPIQRPYIVSKAQSIANMQAGPYRTQVVQNGSNMVVVYLMRVLVFTGEVHGSMKKLGLRSARIEELLAVGEQHPELQRQFEIVALSPNPDDSDSPYLDGNAEKRWLNYYVSIGSKTKWSDRRRLLAVGQ